jgi:N-terminal half of MaoC dehydratase
MEAEVVAARFPVEASHILMFARAIGDPNPIYCDAEYAATSEAGSIIAPPTFAAAAAHFDPDNAMRPKIGEPWLGSGRTPTGWVDRPRCSGGGTGLHAEQHYEYRRPLRPGDVLTERTRKGRTWESEGRRAGKLAFHELISDFYSQDGELVLVARTVVARTERPVSQD